MRSPSGFLQHRREVPARRPVALRVRDSRDVYEPAEASLLGVQATRCMDCGIPFCHAGCPLGNLIPEWNGLAADGRLAEANDRLHATNNFPEFTGAICPAPCESACVLGIADEPVAIERIELEIATRAFGAGLVAPVPPSTETGHAVAVVGSGPAGLAAAQQLRRAGHRVVVFERAERPGGLLRYGIPPFKLEKDALDRRLRQLESEGVEFRCSTAVGTQGTAPGAWRDGPRAPAAVDPSELREQYDAVILATGSTVPRDLEVPGRTLRGVHFALELLRGQMLCLEGQLADPWVRAGGRHVVVIGGGDTGSDCIGTSWRQGAASVTQLEILPRPPSVRPDTSPWPTYPAIYRTSSSQEEGATRRFAVRTVALEDRGDGSLGGVELLDEHGQGERLDADLVVLAMGFTGAERGVLDDLGARLTERGTAAVDDGFETSVPGVFACGDAARGQSLVVWAIAEGRSAAAAVDARLMGRTTLPAPVTPSSLPLA